MQGPVHRDLGEDSLTQTATLPTDSAHCSRQHIPGELVLSFEDNVKTYSPEGGGDGMGSS